jgi:hypothetical protein
MCLVNYSFFLLLIFFPWVCVLGGAPGIINKIFYSDVPQLKGTETTFVLSKQNQSKPKPEDGEEDE